MNATPLLLGVIGGALIVIGANISAKLWSIADGYRDIAKRLDRIAAALEGDAEDLERRRRAEALQAIVPPEGYRPEDF